jgi:hypothetical protein
MNVVPGRGSVTEVEHALKELVDAGVVIKYVVGDETFMRLTDWFETQSFQELHMMRAKYPNPETGECERTMLFKFAKDEYGLRKRAARNPKTKPEKVIIKTDDFMIKTDDYNKVIIKTDDLSVKSPATITTTYSNSSTGESPEPYWTNCDDPTIRFMAEKIASVTKYAGASRPATLERVMDLISRMREIAPDDGAIIDLVTNWHDFHSADTKGKYGKSDPISSMRAQIAYYQPKWSVVAKRSTRQSTRVNRSESMTDELDRITGGADVR